jgi:hypothetical protein
MPITVRHRQNLGGERKVASLAQIMEAKNNPGATNKPAQVSTTIMAEQRSVFDKVIPKQDSFAHAADGLSVSGGPKSSLKALLEFVHEMALS